MRDFDENNITAAVIDRYQNTPDPRLKKIMTSLVQHLHDFVRDVQPTEAEWSQTIDYLTRTGKLCTDKRQEFILLSDTLGVSMLVDAINHRKPGGATENTVLGPFYVSGAHAYPMWADIRGNATGEPCYVYGQVIATDGKPITGAVLDVWQTDGDGMYDVQRAGGGERYARGKFTTGADGHYGFRTVKPVSYPVPTDGPVGAMLLAMSRHPYRPAHVHAVVSAPGYEGVATHIFVAGDPYLDSDAVFGVKNSLVREFNRHP